jgi:hypothetical protein
MEVLVYLGLGLSIAARVPQLKTSWVDETTLDGLDEWSLRLEFIAEICTSCYAIFLVIKYPTDGLPVLVGSILGLVGTTILLCLKLKRLRVVSHHHHPCLPIP